MKRTIRKIAFILPAAALFFTGCLKDRITGDGENVDLSAALRIETRAALNPGDIESKIISLRVLAFDPRDGRIHSTFGNRLYSEAELKQQISHKIYVGTYDFVFIANEPANSSATLAAVRAKSDLDAIAFDAEYFDTGKVIPMKYALDNVEVLVGNAGAKIAGVTHPVWSVELKRLAIRFDIDLYAETDLTTAFKGVEFTNLPDKVPLTGANYTGTRTTKRTIVPATHASHFVAIPDPGTGPGVEQDDIDWFEKISAAPWSQRVERIIMPSHMFTDKGSIEKAMEFTVKLHDNYNPSCIFGIDEAAKNYTSPANTHYGARGKVGVPLMVDIRSKDWTPAGANGSIPDNRTLNVSEIESIVTPTNVVRISFSSNQKNVTLEEKGRFISGGSGEFDVDDYYDGLTGSTPANFTYSYDESAGKGQGQIKVMLNDILPDNGNVVHAITLNAGGLRREIKLDTWMWTAYKYIGTFHRASEVGERIIGFKHAGDWTATVSYTAEQAALEEFVVLSTSFSRDPMINTDTPGDPELYPVVPVGDGQTVSGTDEVYFRVGMKSKLSDTKPDYDTEPRYALITVKDGKDRELTKIYVRQGEAADYLMREGDPISGSLNNATRPLAAKFTPYNITAEDYRNGTHTGGTSIGTSPQLSARGGVFVDYPTQAGAFFQWWGATATTQRRAFSPMHITLNSWNNTQATSSTSYWNLIRSDNETCPSGYRRPQDGKIDGVSSGTVNSSELRQSLVQSPVNVQSDASADNYLVGYYADGFFDRRPLSPAPGQEFGGEAVSPTSVHVAYVGAVLYNAANNASLFFPFAGARMGNSGNLSSNGKGGSYNTASRTDVIARTFTIGYNSTTTYTSQAAPIRCVRP